MTPKDRALIGLLRANARAFDCLAVVETPSTHEMDAILDRIGRLEGVARTETSIALSVKFERPS